MNRPLPPCLFKLAFLGDIVIIISFPFNRRLHRFHRKTDRISCFGLQISLYFFENAGRKLCLSFLLANQSTIVNENIQRPAPFRQGSIHRKKHLAFFCLEEEGHSPPHIVGFLLYPLQHLGIGLPNIFYDASCLRSKVSHNVRCKTFR